MAMYIWGLGDEKFVHMLGMTLRGRAAWVIVCFDPESFSEMCVRIGATPADFVTHVLSGREVDLVYRNERESNRSIKLPKIAIIMVAKTFMSAEKVSELTGESLAYLDGRDILMLFASELKDRDRVLADLIEFFGVIADEKATIREVKHQPSEN